MMKVMDMYEHISLFYNDLFPESPLLKQFMKPYVVPNGLALDLGCGTGRLTRILADFDMHVTGVDLDPHMIKTARSAYPDLTFKHQNMLEPVETEKQHLITCFGNTLPHLTFGQLACFFNDVKETRLRQDGHLVIQLLNYERILATRPDALKTLVVHDLVLHRLYTYHDPVIEFTLVLEKADGTVNRSSTTLHPYTRDTLTSMLEALNLKHNSYGSLQHQAFEHHDEHLYLVVKR